MFATLTKFFVSIFTSRLNLEFQRYMQTKDPAKTCSRLEWWEAHKTEFPLFLFLEKCVKYILAIPASSATSERFFSAGGIMVTTKRTLLAEDTVEDLLMIKLNLEKVENIEKNNGVSVGLEKRKRLATEDDVEDNEVEVCVKKRELILIQMMTTTNNQVLISDFKISPPTQVACCPG